jgi:putative hydrolase of the HAD superfamily
MLLEGAPIDGVTFDLDGTLYEGADVRVPMLVRCLFGGGPRLRVLRVGRQVREELRARTFENGALMLAEEAHRVGERLELSSDEARVLIETVFERSLAAVLRRRRDPRTHAALASLAARAKIGVVSDRGVDTKLAALGLDDLPWAAKVSAEDTGALKPSPKGFVAACARMGVEPARALHVGDRLDMDGAGAHAAGMRFAHARGPRDLAATVAAILEHAATRRRDVLDEAPPSSP